jgi:hypothetical protein
MIERYVLEKDCDEVRHMEGDVARRLSNKADGSVVACRTLSHLLSDPRICYGIRLARSSIAGGRPQHLVVHICL